MVVPQKVIVLAFDPTNDSLGCIPKRTENTCAHKMQTNVHSNIHMSQKVETTEMSVNEWMDKQNVVIYNL